VQRPLFIAQNGELLLRKSHIHLMQAK
jgi:DNA-directed RNA polymerase II subunit RPB2